VHPYLTTFLGSSPSSPYDCSPLASYPIWGAVFHPRNDRQRLEPAFKRSGECILWTGATNGRSHGIYRGRPVYRRVYEHFRGQLTPGLELHHLCGNGLCCNPDHLQPVTRRQHRRIPHRTENALRRYKLTESQVVKILQMCADGWSQAEVARRFGVSPTMISLIANGERWSDVVIRFRSQLRPSLTQLANHTFQPAVSDKPHGQKTASGTPP